MTVMTRATRKVTWARTVKIVAYNGQYRITLPKDLVEDKGWRAGTELRFVEDEHGRVYLKKIRSRRSRH